MAIKVRMTITEELFETWKQCRMRGDVNEITKLMKVSRPVIERALNSGFVVQQGLADKITEFFTKRLEESQVNSERLKKMFNEKNTTS
jgi:hypothetical protein